MKKETKVSVDPKTLEVIKTEVPVFEMPTELRKPNFEMEGTQILCELIPVEKKMVEVKVEGKDETWSVEGETTPSGLIIPTTTKTDRSLKGLIVSVGDTVKEKYKPGDIVIFKPHQPCGVQIDGYDYIVLEQYLIIGKYTN